jgi:tRNA(fMet)-specific endonuclease VapC
MRRVLLDTSAYAAFRRGHPELKAVMQAAAEIIFNPVVLGELRSGFLKGTRAAQNERELRDFLASPRCRVVVIDDDTADRYAVIHDYLRRQGTPVSPSDLWIGASAAQHGLRVVTLDGDFERMPQVFVSKLGPLDTPS